MTKAINQGFTLLEVLLVALVLLVIAGMSISNFSPIFSKLQLDQSINDLAYLMRYAQSRAIVKNKVIRLQFDEEKASYRLLQEVDEDEDQSVTIYQVVQPSEDVPAASAASSKVNNEVTDEELEFENVTGRYGKVNRIPDTLEVTGESPSIDFFPDGHIDSGSFDVCQEKRCRTVTTQGQWGRVRVLAYDDES